jgi:integrase
MPKKMGHEEGFAAQRAVGRPRKPIFRKSKPKPIAPPDVKQVAAILESVKGHPLEALFVLAATTGLRQGELFALEWEDVDLKDRSLAVRRSVDEVLGQSKITDLKSAAARRTVQLPALAVEAVKVHRKKTSRTSGTIFTDADGGWIRRTSFQRRVWKPVLKAACMDGLRFHDLRNAHASLLMSQGVHPKVVQERLGFSSIQSMMDFHLLPVAQDEAVKATDRAFRRPGPNGL